MTDPLHQGSRMPKQPTKLDPRPMDTTHRVRYNYGNPESSTYRRRPPPTAIGRGLQENRKRISHKQVLIHLTDSRRRGQPNQKNEQTSRVCYCNGNSPDPTGITLLRSGEGMDQCRLTGQGRTDRRCRHCLDTTPCRAVERPTGTGVHG